MRAITLHEPYASLVAAGLKPYETRSWPAPRTIVGQRIAIHAAVAVPPWIRSHLRSPYADELVALCRTLPGWNPKRKDLGLPIGHVLCQALVAACLPMIGTSDPPHLHNGEDRLFVSVHPMWGPKLYRTNLAGGAPLDQTHLLPTGDFQAGRFAWELVGVERLDVLVPARGRQGIWHFSEA